MNEGMNKNSYKTHVKDNEHELWCKFFNLNDQCFRKFKKEYQFAHMIETDGVACSVIFVKKSVAHLRFKPKLAKQSEKESYLCDLPATKLNTLKDKIIVGIDPGKSDLI